MRSHKTLVEPVASEGHPLTTYKRMLNALKEFARKRSVVVMPYLCGSAAAVAPVLLRAVAHLGSVLPKAPAMKTVGDLYCELALCDLFQDSYCVIRALIDEKE